MAFLGERRHSDTRCSACLRAPGLVFVTVALVSLIAGCVVEIADLAPVGPDPNDAAVEADGGENPQDAPADTQPDLTADAHDAWEEDGDVCGDADGTPCPDGVCRAGACCQGCWDGTTCRAGDTAAHCGKQGGLCSACGCSSDRCEEGLCVPESPVRDLSLGTYHTCVVLHDGTLWCWGANDHGQVSIAVPPSSKVTAPLRVDDGTEWAQVAAGSEFSCGIRLDTTRVCWGRNHVGQLGVGDTEPHDTLVVGPDKNDSVSAGYDYGCSLSSVRRVTCWGINGSGQLGTGSTSQPGVPTEIVGGGLYQDLGLGRVHACGVRIDGTLWCWGYNIDGELGLGDYVNRDVPAQVGTDSDWSTCAGGGFHSCGLTTAGALFCWGGNLYGQVGQGVVGPGNIYEPTRVGSDDGWTSVVAGRSHVCATRNGGELWCWGWNEGGQLGLGHQDTQGSPVRVGADTGWVQVAGGDHHTCAYREGGALYCWGTNDRGQLGVTSDIEPAPVRVCIPSP